MTASPARPFDREPQRLAVLAQPGDDVNADAAGSGLVGRDAELRTLDKALRGTPSVVVVEGEVGIGKTRLVTEALAQLPPRVAVQLVGMCRQLSQPEPLGPVVDAIRRARPVLDATRLSPLTSTLRRLVPELAPSLPWWSGADPPPLDRDVVRRAVLELLGALGPAILVLEDLQWCDPGTLDLLRCLVGDMPGSLSLVMTYRGEEVGPGEPLRTLTSRCDPRVDQRHIRLRPLTAAEVHELAGRIVADPAVSAELTARLHLRTGGIPFVVEEMVRWVDERNAGSGFWARARPDELEAPGVPRSVEAIVRERVARLPADAQRLAEASAVLAVPADIDLLMSVSGLSRSRAVGAVRGALRAAVLIEHRDATYGHRHALAAEAVHESLPLAERQLLHRRAAAALDAAEPRPFIRLTRHLRECGSIEQWTQAAEAAADVALDAWDTTTASRVLTEVLPAARCGVRERARLALKAARAANIGGPYRREAAALLGGLLEERTLPQTLRGEVRHARGDLLHALGESTEARRELRRCLDDLHRRAELRAHTLASLAVPWGLEETIDDHLRDANAVVEALPAIADQGERINLLTLLAQAFVATGDRRAALTVRQIPWRDPAPPFQAPLLWGEASLIDPWFQLGEYTRARAWLEATTRRLHVILGRAATTDHLEAAALALDWAVGAWDGLEARADALIERQARDPAAVTRSRRIAGLVALAEGRFEAAELSLCAAFADAESVGAVAGMAAVAAGLVRCRLAMGDRSGALAEAERGLEPVRRKGIWVWAAELAPAAVEAYLACGATTSATELVETFADGVRDRPAPLASASAALCRALVARASGDTRTTVRHLDLAERRYAALPRPHDAAGVAARRGTLLLDLGETRGAPDVVRALETFTGLGAGGDAAQMRRVLRRHSIKTPSAGRRGRIGHGAGLTPRQQEIATLAADGYSNREIGSRLGLSPRTVGTHLALALDKLGVRSRIVLARRWDGRTSSLRPES